MSSTASSEIQSFIEQQPQEIQQLLRYYCDLLFSMDLNTKIRFKIPFFDHYSWVCYINPIKKEGIELAFLHGQQLSDEHLLLDHKGRKQVSGIILKDTHSIPDEWIRELVAEAMVLDEHLYQKRKKTRS